MFLQRIIGVFTLNADTFEDIERDESALPQAAAVVAIVAVVQAIVGAGLSAVFGGDVLQIVLNLLSSLVVPFIGWAAFAGVTYLVGTSFFGGKSDYGQMLRVVGFAFAPQIIGIIPIIGWFIGLLWTIAAVFVAVRQGMDMDNTQAAITLVASFVVYIIIVFCASFTIGLFVGVGSAATGGMMLTPFM